MLCASITVAVFMIYKRFGGLGVWGGAVYADKDVFYHGGSFGGVERYDGVVFVFCELKNVHFFVFCCAFGGGKYTNHHSTKIVTHVTYYTILALLRTQILRITHR